VLFRSVNKIYQGRSATLSKYMISLTERKN
jgi:hypothetical protein